MRPNEVEGFDRAVAVDEPPAQDGMQDNVRKTVGTLCALGVVELAEQAYNSNEASDEASLAIRGIDLPRESGEDGYNELVTFMRDGGRGPDMDAVLRGD